MHCWYFCVHKWTLCAEVGEVVWKSDVTFKIRQHSAHFETPFFVKKMCIHCWLQRMGSQSLLNIKPLEITYSEVLGHGDKESKKEEGGGILVPALWILYRWECSPHIHMSFLWVLWFPPNFLKCLAELVKHLTQYDSIPLHSSLTVVHLHFM